MVKLLPIVFLCVFPPAWFRNYLIQTDNKTGDKTDDKNDTTKNDDSVEEVGVDYYGSNYEESEEEFKPTKTTCEEWAKELPKMCKRIEAVTLKKSGELEAQSRQDVLEMDSILRWKRMYDNPSKDKRLVDKRSR